MSATAGRTTSIERAAVLLWSARHLKAAVERITLDRHFTTTRSRALDGAVVLLERAHDLLRRRRECMRRAA